MARRMKRDRIELLRDDLAQMIEDDGDTVNFVWKEMSGGVWNETYEVWEGGVEAEKSYKIKGLGKVVDYAEDEMEYEYGRVRVGDSFLRFPWDADLTPIMEKEGVRFIFKGQRWKIDSPIGIGDVYADNLYSLSIKGVKTND